MISVDNQKILAAQGTTFAEWEENRYHDSYFYAKYFDVKKGEIKVVEYDATAHAGCGSAEIDSTRENVQHFLALKNVKTRQLQEALHVAKIKSAKLQKGSVVEVVRGRKVAKGTKGVVFWMNVCNFDKYNRTENEVIRIGIKDSEGMVYWTYAHNVEVLPEVVNPREVVKKLKQKRSKAYKMAIVF